MLESGQGGMLDAGVEEDEIFLNITPMINVLVCLLFFLLASFGQVIIALINASVPVMSDAPAEPNASDAKLTMGVNIQQNNLLVTASHDQLPESELSRLRKTFGKVKGDYDYNGLHEHLWKVKRKYPKSTSIIITPHKEILYDVVIKVMDASRSREGGTPRRPVKIPMFPEAVISTIVE